MLLPGTLQPSEKPDLSDRAQRRAALAALAVRIRDDGGSREDLRRAWRAMSNRFVFGDLWRMLCRSPQ